MPSNTPVAISMGEPAGIGPDLIVSLYAERMALGLPPFAVYGDAGLLESRAARLGLDIKVHGATDLDLGTVAALFPDQLPVMQIGAVADAPGIIKAESAPIVIESIRRAVNDCKAGACRALVTAPIQKSALYAAGFEHPGHTEFLAALCAFEEYPPVPVMMLAFGDLRAIPLTIHIPLRNVADQITNHLIVETCRIAAADLKSRFRIMAPRIGVLGVNPHAGEDGTIGTEERDIIGPAISQLQLEGIEASGPYSADTIFYPPNWRQFDVVIAMYHDQALIPVKTLGFDEGVNITLGLPIVRTSPDHGTALSLAGTGTASTKSMLAALRMAEHMSAN